MPLICACRYDHTSAVFLYQKVFCLQDCEKDSTTSSELACKCMQVNISKFMFVDMILLSGHVSHSLTLFGQDGTRLSTRYVRAMKRGHGPTGPMERSVVAPYDRDSARTFKQKEESLLWLPACIVWALLPLRTC